MKSFNKTSHKKHTTKGKNGFRRSLKKDSVVCFSFLRLNNKGTDDYHGISVKYGVERLCFYKDVYSNYRLAD